MPSESQADLVIENRLSELVRVERWLAGLVNDWAIPTRCAFAVDLVINEAVTNVISYGYRDLEAHAIRIALADRPTAIEVTIVDDAEPFNPFEAPAQAQPSDLEHAAVGGRGIHLIRSYAPEHHYDFVAGHNHLTLQIEKS